MRKLRIVWPKEIVVTFFEEISERVRKSLITPIMNRLHRLESIEAEEKSVESVFEICVIGELN